VYSGTIFYRELVLDQEAHLVGHVIPQIGRKADAVADAVPVHAFELLVQASHPVPVPGLVPALGVLEAAEGSDVRTSHQIRLAVEDRPAAGAIESKRPHPEARHDLVAARTEPEPVEERVFRTP